MHKTALAEVLILPDAPVVCGSVAARRNQFGNLKLALRWVTRPRWVRILMWEHPSKKMYMNALQAPLSRPHLPRARTPPLRNLQAGVRSARATQRSNRLSQCPFIQLIVLMRTYPWTVAKVQSELFGDP